MRRWAAAAISLYQAVLRPVLPAACRFHPTCSEYARQAVLERGLWRGALLTLGRLSRCHPYHPGGLDPLPRHG